MYVRRRDRAGERVKSAFRHGLTLLVLGAGLLVLLAQAPVASADRRDDLFAQFGDVIYRWVDRHPKAEATFADYYVDTRGGGHVYVGFTEAQDEEVAELKRQLNLVAPNRVSAFPVEPQHTIYELDALEEIISEETDWSLLSSIGIRTKLNLVGVGTTHVAKVRALFKARYGADAPIKVVYERPGILL